MSDLDRLLELARDALRLGWVPWPDDDPPSFSASCDPATIIGLIERVKRAEAADWDAHYKAHTKAQVQLTALEAERDALQERVKIAEGRSGKVRRGSGKVASADMPGHRIEFLEARLRAAEEVVSTTRRYRGTAILPEPVREALRHYDEAVKETSGELNHRDDPQSFLHR